MRKALIAVLIGVAVVVVHATTPDCSAEWTSVRSLTAALSGKISSSTKTQLLSAVDQFRTDGCVAPPPPVPPTSISVPPGGDVQAAINQATTIVLQAGATYRGNYILPKKGGTITTSAALPGRRVTPADSALFPKIVSADNQSPQFTTADGANNWLLVGLQLEPLMNDKEMVVLGGDRTTQTTVAQQPQHIVVDQCFLRGDPVNGQHRGIRMNGAYLTVTRSYFKDFFEVARDSQALVGWNGSGPFDIEDNYIEASGENVLFGGADSASVDLMPRNLTLRHNTITKPLSWKTSNYQIKTGIELKVMAGALIEGNIVENSWAAAQPGFLILVTGRSQDGTNPWATVSDVTFQYNVIRHGAAGIELMGIDYYFPSVMSANVKFLNNLFYDIGGNWIVWSRGGKGFVFDHNTVDHGGNIMELDDLPSTPPTAVTNNLLKNNEYGVHCGCGAPGTSSINAYMPSATFLGNAIVNAPSYDPYPTGNFLPTVVDFKSQFDSTYRILPSSALAALLGTDGKVVGADIATVTHKTGFQP